MGEIVQKLFAFSSAKCDQMNGVLKDSRKSLYVFFCQWRAKRSKIDMAKTRPPEADITQHVITE